jgi:2-dehydropantoate 2-reductase
MRIAILGAGGVGGVYGAMLARAGNPVAMLARGEHLEALRARGIEVTTPEETFTAKVGASGDVDGLGAVDLALVTVKTYSLDEVAPAARTLAERGADVLPLLNGIDAADRLAAAGVPKERLVGGLTEVSAAKTGPGRVARKSPFARIALGELAGGGSPRVEGIAETLRGAGIETRVSVEIAVDLWRKFAFIASMAAGCGLARTSIGPLRAAPYGTLFFTRAVREVLAVGRARGVALDLEADAARILAFVNGLPEPMKPSLLLDLQSGSRTEVDDLSGAVCRLGREAGVETPVHDTATAALSAADPSRSR